MEEEVDPPPAAPKPVLPYSPGNDFERPLSPAHYVYRQFGLLAVALALFTCGTLISAAIRGWLPTDVSGLLLLSCGCGGLSWISSVCLAIVVAFRDSPGRKWAIAALAINAFSIVSVLLFARQ